MEGMKPGWRRVRFGDVVKLSKTRSKDPPADGFERYVGLEHLEPGDLLTLGWWTIVPEGAKGVSEFADWLRETALGGEEAKEVTND